MKVSNPAPAVCVYEDFYPDAHRLLEEVKIAAELEYSVCPWTRSMVQIKGQSGTHKVEARLSVESNLERVRLRSDEGYETLRDVLSDFVKNLDTIIHDYRAVYDLKLNSDQGFQVLRYENTAEYMMHCDHDPRNMRVLSMVCFLIDDFEGGNLEFPYHELSVSPKAGKAVVFPSGFSYSHIAHPIESGTKYSIVTWYI